MTKKKIGELDIEILGGQIMSRVTVDKNNEDQVVETRRVVIPKCINSDGTVTADLMPEENLRVSADERKLAQKGDIVIKLSTPYDAGMIDDDAVDGIVPSFCAIIRNHSEINDDYLLAFLNSDLCKKQLSKQVAGAQMAVVSVGKIRNIEIPIPSKDNQEKIGASFVESRNRIKTIRRIMELESMKNDIVFRDLEKE